MTVSRRWSVTYDAPDAGTAEAFENILEALTTGAAVAFEDWALMFGDGAVRISGQAYGGEPVRPLDPVWLAGDGAVRYGG